MLSMLKKRFNNWKIGRRFPIRWLTYKARIERDVDEAFALPKAKEIFDYDYVEQIIDAIKQLEAWQVKAMSASFAISAFLVIGFVTDEGSVSLFGISLKQATGLKEVLLAFSATIGLLLALLTQSKETLLAVLAKLAKLTTDKEQLPLVLLATRSSFNLKIYIPRQYDQWIFPTIFTKIHSLLAGLLWIALILFVAGASIVVTLFLTVQIYRHPTLGTWSTVILYYVGAVFLLSILNAIRLSCPLPYRDKSDLKKLSVLEKTDRAAYLALRKKYFGA